MDFRVKMVDFLHVFHIIDIIVHTLSITTKVTAAFHSEIISLAGIQTLFLIYLESFKVITNKLKIVLEL